MVRLQPGQLRPGCRRLFQRHCLSLCGRDRGVLIHPGDLVLEMLTAWLLFPRQMEARILELALEKVADEKRVRSEIEAGATSTAVFDRHGIL